MEKFRKESSFLIFIGVCIVILLLICGLSFYIRGTRAYFPGGTTGTLGGTIYKVIYNSNWPDDSVEDEKIEDKKYNVYMIMDNMFEVPDGYEFVGWVDSNGNQYVSSDVIKLTVDLELFAVWNKLEIEIEDTGIKYGDINKNGGIDEEDYLLIDGYLSGSNNLDDNALLSADVNVDGKIDLVDVDIVKQVYLGNNLYMGKLPNEPILIYDIYEGKIDVGNGGSSDNDDNNDNDGESSDDILEEDNSLSSGTGTGNGQSGSGSGSSGNGGNNQGNSSSSGSSSGSSGNGSVSSGIDNNTNEEDLVDDDISEDDIESEENYYYNRFMNGNLEYMTTRCLVLDDNTCDLILPDNPIKDGYTFTGWSIDKNCSNDSLINKSINISSDNMYYACFIVDNIDDKTNIYVIIMVVGIVFIAGRMIWYLIRRYKDENTNIGEENF